VGSRYEFGMTLVEDEGTLSIVSMLPDSSAQRDGLKIGDVIRSIGGVNLQSQSEFYEVAGLMQAGDQIELVVERSDQDQTILLTIGQPIDNHGVSAAEASADQHSNDAILNRRSLPLEHDPTRSSASVLEGSHHEPNSVASPVVDLTLSASEQALRNSILQKERELLLLQQEIEALKMQLAAAEKSHYP